MGKISKEEQARRDGFEYFVRLYRSQKIRIPEIDEEIRRRGLTGKPIGLDKKSEMEYVEMIQKQTLQVAIVIYVWILHNKLEWGEKRLLRAMQWFWDMADLLTEDYLSYQDIAETLKAETGIQMEFDWLGVSDES